jgi:hypothetical protein
MPGLPGWYPHGDAEQAKPEVFQRRADWMAKCQPTEHQTNAQAPEQDHAALVG